MLNRARTISLVGVVSFAAAALLASCGSASGSPASSGSGGHGSTSDPTTSTTSSSTTTSTSSTTTTTTLPPLQGKVTVLQIGDSLGEDLGFGLQYQLANDSQVHLLADAVGDTGLVRPDYYDWPAHLESDLRSSHPQVVVVFLGANDSQNIATSSAVLQFGTSAWKKAYAARVGQVIDEATSAGARVIWVGMPVMQDPTLSSNVAMMDTIFQQEVASHPGAIYLSSNGVFANSAGQYIPTSSGPKGQTYTLRAPDGIHIAPQGGDLLAGAVLGAMNSHYGLHLKILQPPA